MKAFTVTTASTPGIQIEKPTDSVRFPHLLVGERGRNRWAVYVPAEAELTGTLLSCSIGKRLGATPKQGMARILRERQSLNGSDRALVHLKVPMGFRGSVTYEIGSAELLAEGQIADGAAGRMGSGQELLVILKTGDLVRAHRTGRLYGQESTLVIGFDGEAVWVVELSAYLAGAPVSSEKLEILD